MRRDEADDDVERERKLQTGLDRTRQRQRNKQKLMAAAAATAGPETEGARSRLWVDKYAPKKFTDLLSPEVCCLR